jgi:hypothetical protein
MNEDCWKGYKRVGMKKKGNRVVPNCVPKSENTTRQSIFSNQETNYSFANYIQLREASLKRLNSCDVDAEELDENWRQNMAALALGAASLFPMANAQAAPPSGPQSAMTQSVSQNQQARLDAMKRVSAVHKFKKNWGSEFGPKEDQKLFDAILKLQTEKDHDDFLNLVEKNRADNLKIQMTGSYHPDKFSKQLKIKEIYNSYDFQYSDYMRTLATASKMNL